MDRKFVITVIAIAILYLVIGGFIFRAIEEKNDLEQRKRIHNTLEDFFDNNGSDVVSIEEVKKLIPTLQQAFLYGVNVEGNLSSSSSNWDLYSSIFFSVTVVTTIGYGNSPLKTEAGRMFCTFYALAGVPLCLLTLFVIGTQEKRFIYFVAKKLAFGFRQDERKLHAFSTIIVSIGGSAVFVYLSAVIFMKCEEWTYTEALYFCFITLLTVGFGDYVAGWSNTETAVWYRLLIAVWILFGLSWCTIVISVCQDIYNDLFQKADKMAGVVGNLIESSVKSKLDTISTEVGIKSHQNTHKPGKKSKVEPAEAKSVEQPDEKQHPPSTPEQSQLTEVSSD